MLYTWAVESVLIGLVGVSALRAHWMVAAQFWMALVSLGLQLGVTAADWDGGNHAAAVGYLTVVTGFLEMAAMEPMDDV
jgi:hypothetical protein